MRVKIFAFSPAVRLRPCAPDGVLRVLNLRLAGGLSFQRRFYYVNNAPIEMPLMDTFKGAGTSDRGLKS